jgi:hypothetical protein
MSRPRAGITPDDESKMLALARQGLSSRVIASRLAADGCAVSHRTIARRLAALAPAVLAERAAALVKPPKPEEAPPVPMAPDAGATLSAAERQVDALLARSPVWRRIQAAIASSLATHPAAAAAVARALREVTL